MAKTADKTVDQPSPLDLTAAMEAMTELVRDATAEHMGAITDKLPALVNDAIAATLPKLIEHVLSGFKDWTRREIRLMQDGHSEQTRIDQNP